MRSICGFIFSLLMAGMACRAQDQQPAAKDTTSRPQKPAPPKEPKDFRPTGLRVGTDLISLIKSQTQKDFHGWEMNADVDFANYFLVVDVGNWSREYTLPNGDYENGGSYYRAGVDLNILKKDPDHNMFFFGFRYGQAHFHESLTYQETLPVFGTVNHTVSNAALSGSWVELVTGLRMKVWKQLWMGYTARMKFAANVHGGSPSLSSFDMPGYGTIQQAPWWGFNYQLFWRFPIRKEKKPAAKP